MSSLLSDWLYSGFNIKVKSCDAFDVWKFNFVDRFSNYNQVNKISKFSEYLGEILHQIFAVECRKKIRASVMK